jgi:hypothetical protein
MIEYNDNNELQGIIKMDRKLAELFEQMAYEHIEREQSFVNGQLAKLALENFSRN